MIRTLLKNRILCLDGAMGTAIQERDPSDADFGGAEFDGCNEHLNVTRPDLIEDIHASHLRAGADIIETNTFGSASIVMAEYPPLDQKAHEITLVAAQIARRAADKFATAERPRFVAGSMGPTTKAISVTGGVTFRELIDTFRQQADALLRGGCDYLLLETQQDTRNIKAGLIGIENAFAATGVRVPIAVSGTIEPMGTMLGGQTAEALTVSMSHVDLLYLGLNCATGPEFMTDHLRAMAELSQAPIGCVPNAGLPDEDGNYLESPAMIAGALERFVKEGWVNLVGGCCGTTDAHIAALAEMIAGRKPRRVLTHKRALYSGLEMVEAEESNRPLLVGERTNSLGSRRFKKLIADEKFEEASEIARKQVRKGAQIIDVCLQNPDRDEPVDMRRFLEQLINKVKAPLMIDSTDADVTDLALTYCQGKAIINSVNLEDGLERFERVVPQALRFGAALVVGCIDEDREQGMAVTRARKLEVARRSHKILTEDFGLDETNIIFDPLVFPCATGDVNYLGSARETVEGIRLIKQELPHTRTILGISNVSFGLPPAGREVLNAVFLYHCTKAGLDMAIVNTEKLERYAQIPPEELALAEAVLFDSGDESIAAFTAHFRDASSRIQKDVSTLTLDERLANYILTGSKEGLVKDLDEKLKDTPPLEVINGPLMAGMDEVGRLFNNNELIVAEVLQSAEAMKAAVAHLEQFMERDDDSRRGTILLATVKGDVHDIGKNLVDIILTNNGYRVINLGIKIPPRELIAAIDEHDPDVVGLSGLLVKSAQQMVVTAEEMTVHGKCPPMLVGGAALTRNFTRKRIDPKYEGVCLYAKDAMDGLDLANRLLDPNARAGIVTQIEEERQQLIHREASKAKPAPMTIPARSNVTPLAAWPAPPDTERHVMRTLPLDEVWSYLNPLMLYGKHLGLKGRFDDLLAAGDEKAQRLHDLLEGLKADCRPGGKHPMQLRAVWQFLPAQARKDTIVVTHGGAEHAFPFPRQSRGDFLCLSDFVAETQGDHVAMFVVTAGEGVRAQYEAYKEAGEYLKSHAIQALAIETAEAAAEWLHHKLRGQWGFPDAPETTMRDRFRAAYHGKRYSFGYPACPDLGLQEPLFAILNPHEIGVALTEEHMMDPEASVSAVVFHHPEARYFSVDRED